MAAPAFATSEASESYWNAQRLELAGKSSEAMKSYAKLLAQSPESTSAADSLFAIAVREGSINDAIIAVRAMQKLGTADTDAPLLNYVDAFRRRNWHHAQEAIAALETERNFAFIVPILKGWLNVAQGLPSGLSNTAMQSSGLTAYYGDDQLIYFDFADGNLAQAQLRLRNFTGYDEPHGRFLATVGIGAFRASGDSAFAIMLAQQIGLELDTTQIFPKISPEVALASLFSRLSFALDAQKQSDKALYFARLANWIEPNNDFATIALAEIANRSGFDKKAQAALDKIGYNSPFWIQSVVDRAQFAPTPQASVTIAENAAAMRPNSAQLKMLLGQWLERAGRQKQAIDVYRSLVDLNKDGYSKGQRAIYLLMLASALDASGDWHSARKALEDALVANPQNVQALNFLGYSLLERRLDIKRGFELVAQAHALAPQSAAITDSLGWAYFLNGNLDKAIPLLERAVAGAIDDVAINEHLGDAYWAAGRKTEARFAWKAAALSAKDEAGRRLAQKIDLGWTADTASP
ncbi:MAG: tetratricopeptide repeat protein [Sphingorhabdus sp.]